MEQELEDEKKQYKRTALLYKSFASIARKTIKTFKNSSTKNIGEVINELPAQKVQDLRTRLERIRDLEERILSGRLGQGGRGARRSELQSLLEHGELEGGRDSQLADIPLFGSPE